MDFETSAVNRFAAAIREHHAALTELDQKSGDGDFGDNLVAGIARAYPGVDSAPGFGTVSQVFLDEVGGTSGPLFGLLFQEFARAFSSDRSVRDLVQRGAADGLAAIQRVGEAEVGDRTMVDALAPAAQALADGGSIADAAQAAADGAASTKSVRARMGRASYVGDRALGSADPGAAGVALFFAAVAEAADAKRPDLSSVF